MVMELETIIFLQLICKTKNIFLLLFHQITGALPGSAPQPAETYTHTQSTPVRRRHGKLLHPNRKARADLVATARLDGLFGQRWKAETVNSVIKRNFVTPSVLAKSVCNNVNHLSKPWFITSIANSCYLCNRA